MIAKYLHANNNLTPLNLNSKELDEYYSTLNLTNTQGEKQEIQDKFGNLNPLVKKWMWMSNLFKNEYLYISAKGEYMHPHKAKLNYRGDKPSINFDDLAIEMSGRLASMAKRNVIFTATIELPSRNQKNGTPNNVNLAVIEDLTAQMYNIAGQTKNNQEVHDGSSTINYVYSKLVENSYPGKSYKGTKKQFGTFITDYSCVVKKDAETVVTNDIIRNSNHSEISYKNKQYQMFSAFNLDGLRTTPLTPDNLFVMDSGINKQITSYLIKDNKIYIIYNNDLLNKVVKPANTLYEVWEALGGEYSMDVNGEFNEGSNEELFNIVVNNDLKEQMIHIISNKSSIKAGGTNINSNDLWKSKDKLMFTTYENRHMGPQLDAGHEADASEIKEVTQVVSALAQNGNTAHLAQEVYENLASTIKKAAAPYKKYLGNKTDDLYNYMARKFIDKMSKSDNVSLAKNILESLPKDLQVPFSNQNFFQAFVKDVISRMNDEFITRYYRGIGAVLNPSHGIIKLFEDSNGNVIKQEDLAKAAFADYQLNTIMYQPNSSNEEIIKQYLEKTYPSKPVDVSEIQPGDSYDIVLNVDGLDLKTTHTLDTIEKYYKFKKEFAGQTVMKSFSVPRDLKPSEITFEITTGLDEETNLPVYEAKNIFDTDSIRLRYILNKFKEGSIDKTDSDYLILLNFMNAYMIPLELIENVWDKKNEEAQKAFKKVDNLLNAWTQRNLQLLDNHLIMNPVDINTDFTTYFNGDDLIKDIFEDAKHLYNGRTINVTNYKFKPAELILPNIYKSDFETNMDSITTIRNNPNYFVDKLQKQFELTDDNSDFIISLGDNNPKIYVKYVVDLPSSNSKVSIITDREEIDGELKTVKIRLDELGNKMYILPENSKVIVDDSGKETLYIKAASKHLSKVVTEYHIIEEGLNDTIKQLIKSFNGKIDAIIPTMNSVFKEYVERFDKEW